MSILREGKERRWCWERIVTRAAAAVAIAAIGVVTISAASVLASQRGVADTAVGTQQGPPVIETWELVDTLRRMLDDSDASLMANDDLSVEPLGDVDAFADTDQDSVPDAQDCEPLSDLRPTIVLGDRDTAVPNQFFTSGCTTADLIASVERVATNHGQYVSGVAHLTKSLSTFGVLDERDRGAIMSAAARTK